MTLPALPDQDARAPEGRLIPRFSAFRSIGALVLREMGHTYGRTPGGYVWAVIEPLAGIVILSVAFSLILRHPPLGTSFMLFYASGYLPFTFFSGLARKIQVALNLSRALLSYPRVTWLDAVIARFVLNVVTDILVITVVFIVLFSLIDAHTVIDIMPLLTALVMAAVLGLGVGLMNAFLIGFFPLWGTLWNIMTRPLFIASGVLFTYEGVAPNLQAILWWNPLIHVVSHARTGFYPSYDATFVSMTFVFGVGLTLMAFGMLFLNAWHKLVLEQ
jgi:capsular polysaccharide transport system permease protein